MRHTALRRCVQRAKIPFDRVTTARYDDRPPGNICPINGAATWRSGYAPACKAVYAGSIPAVASINPRQIVPFQAGVAILRRYFGKSAPHSEPWSDGINYGVMINL